MPGKYDLVIFSGAAVEDSFQWERDKVLVNLVGWSARAKCRALPQPGAPLVFDWSTANGKLLLDANGNITPQVGDVETAALWRTGLPSKGTRQQREVFLLGHWDLELTPPTGETTRLLQGMVLISPEVTA